MVKSGLCNTHLSQEGLHRGLQDNQAQGSYAIKQRKDRQSTLSSDLSILFSQKFDVGKRELIYRVVSSLLLAAVYVC